MPDIRVPVFPMPDIRDPVLPMPDIRVPVLIVGSGLAGLTAAVMLSWRGVRPLRVERHPDTSKNPRARGVNFRTMELLRVAGLEPDLMAEGGGMRDFSIIIAETVTGKELRTILPRGAWDTSNLSPAQMSGAGQDQVEPILRRHAEALGADIRYSTELTSFDQDDLGVTATIRDRRTGVESQVRAGYLIGADGNRSPVRQRLGIGLHGTGSPEDPWASLSHNIAMVFEADLEPALGGRSLALYYLQNPDFTGAFINIAETNRALVTVEYDPGKEKPSDFDEPRCIGLIRAAIGSPDLEVDLVEVMPWEMSSRTADRFAQGRVFLIGDAAHTMPPTGGLGGQTAMQDAYDLAWKLAMVIHGQAGTNLLATYETKRKPVCEMTVSLQTANYVERMRPDRKDLQTGAVLLRPDGYIAWRARTAGSSALTTLKEAVARIMFRSADTLAMPGSCALRDMEAC